MLLKRRVLVASIVIAAGLIVWIQRQTQADLRSENARLRSATIQLQKQIEVAGAELEQVEAQQWKADLDRTPSDAGRVSRSGRAVAAAGSDRSNSAPVDLKQGVTYVSLSKTNLHRLRLRPVTEEFQLSDEAAAVLEMTTAERTAVNKAIEKLITRHNELDLAKAQEIQDHLSTDPGRKTSFRVPAYPEEGQRLAQELLASTQEAIGTNRTAILLGFADLNSLSAEGFEPFGRTEKTITFVDRATDDGQRDCRIVMKVVDSRTGFSLVTSFANADDKIPLNWRNLVQNVDPAR